MHVTASQTSITFDYYSISDGGTLIDTYTITGTAPGLICEDFESGYTDGSNIGAHPDWFDDGNGPVITAGNGVAGSIGLAPGSNIFIWTANPFDWNAPDFVGFNVQMDFQTDGSGAFNDDRIGWQFTDDSVSSSITSWASSWIPWYRGRL